MQRLLGIVRNLGQPFKTGLVLFLVGLFLGANMYAHFTSFMSDYRKARAQKEATKILEYRDEKLEESFDELYRKIQEYDEKGGSCPDNSVLYDVVDGLRNIEPK